MDKNVYLGLRFLLYTGIGLWISDLFFFLWRRLGDSSPPWELGILLVVVMLLFFLPLPYLPEKGRKAYLGGGMVMALGIGALLFSHPVVTFLLLVTGLGLGVKLGSGTLTPVRFFLFFLGAVSMKAALPLLFFFSSYAPWEKTYWLSSFLPYLILYLLSSGLFPFIGTDKKGSKWEKMIGWAKWNGLLMGVAAGLFLLSLFGVRFLMGGWAFLQPLLTRGILLLLSSLFSFIPSLRPWIRAKLEQQGADPLERGNSQEEPPPPLPETTASPVVEWGIALFTSLLLFSLLFLIGRLVRRWIREGAELRVVPHEREGSWSRERVSAGGRFKTIGPREDGGATAGKKEEKLLLRRKMREYLLLLQEEGKWSPSSSVASLVREDEFPALPSALYEKLRYGEIPLTAEEEEIVLKELEKRLAQRKRRELST